MLLMYCIVYSYIYIYIYMCVCVCVCVCVCLRVCLVYIYVLSFSSPYLLVFGDDRVRGTREQMMLQVELVRLSRLVGEIFCKLL